MKLYIAGGFSNQRALKQFADRLISQGHEVTSRWLYLIPPFPTDFVCAHMDMDDIEPVDMLIAVSPQNSTQGGTWFEVGYAMGLRKGIGAIAMRPLKDGRLSIFSETIKLRWETEDEFLNWLGSTNQPI